MTAIHNTICASLLLVGVAGGATLQAAETARDLAVEINDANRALRSGNVDAAIGAYRQAHELAPENADLSYNMAVAQYRKGDISTATRQFQAAAVAENDAIAEKARFNLGNCNYASALHLADKDPPAAIESLKSAIGNYQSALEIDSSDADARANIELANRLIDRLREKDEQRRREQQQQQNNQQQSDKQQDQDQKKQQASRDNQQQNQQQQGQNSDQQNKPQDQQGQSSSANKAEDKKNGSGQEKPDQKGELPNNDEKQSQSSQDQAESQQQTKKDSPQKEQQEKPLNEGTQSAADNSQPESSRQEKPQDNGADQPQSQQSQDQHTKGKRPEQNFSAAGRRVKRQARQGGAAGKPVGHWASSQEFRQARQPKCGECRFIARRQDDDSRG